MIILGTCNFNRDYNNSNVKKKDCFRLLEYYESNGGIIVDTAYNYYGVHFILAEYFKVNKHSKLKIQTKITYIDEFEYCIEDLKRERLYSCLARDNNQITIEYLKKQKENKYVEKYGQSIYYKHELRSDVNIIQMPLSPKWRDEIETMSLYADLQFRSYYNLYLRKYADDNMQFFNSIRHNEKVSFVVGVDTLEQLKENMKLFGV